MNGPEILQCKEWRGEEAFPEGELNKFAIDGIEEIAGDLSNHSSWNGTKPIGTIVLGTEEGSQITSTILHLFGKITDKFVDAKHLWQGARESSYFKISSLDLSTFTFRGSLSSSYLSSRDQSHNCSSQINLVNTKREQFLQFSNKREKERSRIDENKLNLTNAIVKFNLSA